MTSQTKTVARTARKSAKKVGKAAPAPRSKRETTPEVGSPEHMRRQYPGVGTKSAGERNIKAAQKVANKKAGKADHPADTADREAVKSATSFTVHLKLSRSETIHKEFKTLARAVLCADQLRAEHKRDVLVYAITPKGSTVHVPKAMQEAVRLELRKLAEQRADVAKRTNRELASKAGQMPDLPKSLRRTDGKTVQQRVVDMAKSGSARKQADEHPGAKLKAPSSDKPAAKVGVTSDWLPAYQPNVKVGEIKKGSKGEKLIKLLRNEKGITDQELSEKAGTGHAISSACAAAARAGLKVQRRRVDGKVVYRIKP